MTLGASVAVATPITSIITEDAILDSNPTAVEFNSDDLGDTTTKNSVGGIVVNPANTTTIKVTSDATLKADASKLSPEIINAYGIYVGGDKNVIFKGQNSAGDAESNRILTIGTLAQKGTGKVLAFNNAGTGTVTFNGVGLASGTSSGSDTYGIFIKNVEQTYNFGTNGNAKTVFIVQGQNTTGLSLESNDATKQKITLTGNLEMRITSEDGATPNAGGGEAKGLSIKNGTQKGGSHNFTDLDLTFTSIKAGNGNGTGAGGDVIGIHRNNGQDSTLKGGKITFKELVAGKGTGGQGKIYVIKNEIPNSTPLTLDGTQIIVGSAPTSGHYGIYDNLGNTHYIFGDIANKGETIINLKETGTALGLNGDTTLKGKFTANGKQGANGISNNDGYAGNSITGVAFLKNGSQSFDNFQLEVNGGTGGTGAGSGKGGKGGDAIGILASADTTIALTGPSSLTIKNGLGGKDGSGGGNGEGGNATGLQVNNATLTIKGTNSDKIGTFKVGAGTGGGDATATSATAINLQGAKLHLIDTGAKANDASDDKALGITFDVTNGYIYADKTNGTATLLQSSGTSEFLGKLTVADNAIAGKTRNILDNQGTLTLGSKDFAGSIIVGTAPADTAYGILHNVDDTAKPLNFNLGNLTINFGQEFGDGSIAKVYGIATGSTSKGATFSVGESRTLTIKALTKNENFDKFKAFDRKVRLNMGKNSNLILESDGGILDGLTADSATILLSGDPKGKRYVKGASDKLYFRTLNITNLDANGSTFVVLASGERNALDATNKKNNGAYQLNKDGKTWDRVQGGSDRIVIGDNTATTSSKRLNNTLKVGLRGLATESIGNQYVILATVDKKEVSVLDADGNNTGKTDKLSNLVTFNGLKDGQSTKLDIYSGFDTASLTLSRYDTEAPTPDHDEEGGNVPPKPARETFGTAGAIYYTDLGSVKNEGVNESFTDTTSSMLASNYFLMAANLNSLSKRLGELRDSSKSQGIWGRVFGGRVSSEFGVKQSTDYLTFQAGYDYGATLENGNNYTGLAISYITGSSIQDRQNFNLNVDPLAGTTFGNASTRSNGVEVALYNTFVSDMGLYSDSIVKVGYFTSDISIPATLGFTVDNFSIAVSEEVGYRIALGANSEWIITPQIELAYGAISASDTINKMADASWMRSAQDAIHTIRTRVGAAWGYNFDHLSKDNGIKAGIYVGTYYTYDVNLGGETKFQTSGGQVQTLNSIKSDGRFVLNLGTDISVQETTKFYVDFEKSFAGQAFQTDYQISAGVRYSFGERAVKKENIKKDAPLKLSDEENQTQE